MSPNFACYCPHTLSMIQRSSNVLESLHSSGIGQEPLVWLIVSGNKEVEHFSLRLVSIICSLILYTYVLYHIVYYSVIIGSLIMLKYKLCFFILAFCAINGQLTTRQCSADCGGYNTILLSKMDFLIDQLAGQSHPQGNSYKPE